MDMVALTSMIRHICEFFIFYSGTQNLITFYNSLQSDCEVVVVVGAQILILQIPITNFLLQCLATPLGTIDPITMKIWKIAEEGAIPHFYDGREKWRVNQQVDICLGDIKTLHTINHSIVNMAKSFSLAGISIISTILMISIIRKVCNFTKNGQQITKVLAMQNCDTFLTIPEDIFQKKAETIILQW